MTVSNPIEPIPARLQRMEEKLDLILQILQTPQPNYATMETAEQAKLRRDHLHPAPHTPGFPPGYSDSAAS
jgi:hypothetical protein